MTAAAALTARNDAYAVYAAATTAYFAAATARRDAYAVSASSAAAYYADNTTAAFTARNDAVVAHATAAAAHATAYANAVAAAAAHDAACNDAYAIWTAAWDAEPRRINIHRKPKGGVEHRPRPPVLPRTWYERIPFELILFGPWTPYLFAFAVLAGFIRGCSSL